MTDAAQLTALGSASPYVREIGDVTIRENANVSIASIALRRGVSNQSFPPAGVWDGSFWIRQNQWFVTETYDVAFSSTIKQKYGSGASVTDQTDAWVVFDIVAPDTFFEKLCIADIRKMPKNSVVRTTIEYMACFIIKLETSFRVVGERSAAGSLLHALLRAAEAGRH